MTKRLWLYLITAIIIAAIFTLATADKVRSQKENQRMNEELYRQKEASMRNFLAKQTDSRKLISLIKKLPSEDPRILQMIVDRAYELSPNSRDVVLLASYFHPELKERFQELDPLYTPSP